MAYFTTNLAGLILPDLYIAELSPPRRVQGIGTGVVGVIGEFQKGPVDTSTTIGSLAQLVDTFGGRGTVTALDGTVTGTPYNGYISLINKGWQDLRIVRVSNSGQIAASVTLISQDGSPLNMLTAVATWVGGYGNNIKFVVSAGSHTGRKILMYNERNQIYQFDDVDTTTTAGLAKLVTALNKTGQVVVTALQPGIFKLGTFTLTGGADGVFNVGNYTGSLANEVGLRRFEREDDINIVLWAENGPATTAQQVTDMNVALKSHCDNLSNRIGIMCALPGYTTDSIVTWLTGDSVVPGQAFLGDRCVFCFPWLQTFDGDISNNILVAPTSFVAAKIASLSPHVSPSNKELGGIVGTEINLTRAELVKLTTNGILSIAYVKGGGYRIRNGRTTEVIDTGRWQIFRRRMTDYIQIALARSLYWAVSEPHTKELRRQIRQSIVDFLAELESLGMIGDPNGLLPAYNVICDVTNNPGSTVAAGRLYCDVRVRLIAAADFIIIRTEIGEGVITAQIAA
jgi:phage tail sheath protein FI